MERGFEVLVAQATCEELVPRHQPVAVQIPALEQLLGLQLDAPLLLLLVLAHFVLILVAALLGLQNGLLGDAGHFTQGPDEREELRQLDDAVAVHVVQPEDPAQSILRRALADGRQEYQQLLND